MSIEPTARTRRRAMRALEPDLVDRIMAAVVERAPELQPHVAELETAVRDQFAGDRGWVRKRNASRPDLARMVLAHFNGRNVSEVARKLDISRATVYRMLRVAGEAPPACAPTLEAPRVPVLRVATLTVVGQDTGPAALTLLSIKEV